MLRVNQAKKQLPKAEYERFEQVILNQGMRMKPEALRRKLKAARRLRDKHRDLAHRQSVHAKSCLTNKTDVSPQLVKAEIYSAIADRLQKQIHHLA